MKTARFLTTMMTVMFFCLTIGQVNARKNDNLIKNTEQVNGLVVSETIYKNNDGLLSNYVKHNYSRDNQGRIVEQEDLLWQDNQWTKSTKIVHEFMGKQTTTYYYQWNKTAKAYKLVPEMTTSVDQ